MVTRNTTEHLLPLATAIVVITIGIYVGNTEFHTPRVNHDPRKLTMYGIHIGDDRRLLLAKLGTPEFSASGNDTETLGFTINTQHLNALLAGGLVSRLRGYQIEYDGKVLFTSDTYDSDITVILGDPASLPVYYPKLGLSLDLVRQHSLVPQRGENCSQFTLQAPALGTLRPPAPGVHNQTLRSIVEQRQTAHFQALGQTVLVKFAWKPPGQS